MKDKERKFKFGDTAYIKVFLPEAVPGQIMKYNQKRKMYIFLRFGDVSDLAENFVWGYVKEEDLASPDECEMFDYTKDNDNRPLFLKNTKLSKTAFLDFYDWEYYLEKSYKEGKITREEHNFILTFLTDYEMFKLKCNSEMIIKQKYKRNSKKMKYNKEGMYFYKE